MQGFSKNKIFYFFNENDKSNLFLAMIRKKLFSERKFNKIIYFEVMRYSYFISKFSSHSVQLLFRRVKSMEPLTTCPMQDQYNALLQTVQSSNLTPPPSNVATVKR